MTRAAPLLAVLAALYASTLALAWWLGLLAMAQPRIVDSEPRLVLKSAAADDMGAAELRAALLAAGMDANGALWRVSASADDAGRAQRNWQAAVEMLAEDARGLRNLGARVKVERLGGEPVLEVTLPDRGMPSASLALPLAEARVAAFAEQIEARILQRRQRRSEDRILLQWVLAEHPRGEAAPAIPLPILEAPKLPVQRQKAEYLQGFVPLMQKWPQIPTDLSGH